MSEPRRNDNKRRLSTGWRSAIPQRAKSEYEQDRSDAGRVMRRYEQCSDAIFLKDRKRIVDIVPRLRAWVRGQTSRAKRSNNCAL